MPVPTAAGSTATLSALQDSSTVKLELLQRHGHLPQEVKEAEQEQSRICALGLLDQRAGVEG